MEELIKFLYQYYEFLQKFAKNESEKLSAISCWKLSNIEKSISDQQANEKKLENLERTREQLQQNAGLEGMTFREIIKVSDQKYQPQLTELFSKIEAIILDIKYYNTRSMTITEENLKNIGKEISQEPVNFKKNPFSASEYDHGGLSATIEFKV